MDPSNFHTSGSNPFISNLNTSNITSKYNFEQNTFQTQTDSAFPEHHVENQDAGHNFAGVIQMETENTTNNPFLLTRTRNHSPTPSSPQNCPSPTLSQRFKRKILCEPLDLDDNYYAQKRYISEKMAAELGILSISPKSPQTDNFIPPNNNNFQSFNPFLVPDQSPSKHLPQKHNIRSVPFSNNWKSINSHVNNNNNNNSKERQVFLFQYNDNDSNNNNKQKQEDEKEKSDTHNFRINVDSWSRKDIKNRTLEQILNPYADVKRLQPDNSMALVLYKSPSDVIRDSLQKQSREELKNAYRKQREEVNRMMIDAATMNNNSAMDVSHTYSTFPSANNNNMLL